MSNRNNNDPAPPLVLPDGMDCQTLARLLINVIERRSLQVCESDRRCLQRASMILSGNDCARNNSRIQIKKEPEEDNLQTVFVKPQEEEEETHVAPVRIKEEPRDEFEDENQSQLEPRNLFPTPQCDITNGRFVNSFVEQQQPEEADSNDSSEMSQRKSFYGKKLLLQGEKPRFIPLETSSNPVQCDPRIRTAEPVKIKTEPPDDYFDKCLSQRVKTERESNRDYVDMDISTPDSPQSPDYRLATLRQNPSANTLWPVSPKFNNINPNPNPQSHQKGSNIPWKFNLIPKKN